MNHAGILDQVTQQFMSALQQDANIFEAAGRHVFFYLCIIQLSVSAMWMVIAGESLQRLVSKFVQLCFMFGFFYGLIQLCSTWVPDIINGFIELGQQDGVQSLDPSSIISQGVSISGAIFKGFFNWGLLSHPFISFVGAIVCLAILVIYALIAAELTIILVKSYVVVSIGSLFFAFGASEYTRTMTMKYISTVIGLGLQLMMLYLLLGVGQHIGENWALMTKIAAKHHQLMPMLVILAAVIVYYMVIKHVPVFIASLSGASGLRDYAGSAVSSTLGAAYFGTRLLSTAKNVGAGVVGAGVQMGATANHMTRTTASEFKKHGVNATGFAKAAKSNFSNIASSAVNTVKDISKGSNKNLSVGQKFNHHLGKSGSKKNE